jgi:hypothetical protein
MNSYQFKVWDCINDRLVEFAQTEAKSLYNLDMLYHHYITEISTLFHNPQEHYSKILALAYRKTEKEYKL